MRTDVAAVVLGCLAVAGVGGVTFTAGNDSVDVVKNTAGQWVVGGITACE